MFSINQAVKAILFCAAFAFAAPASAQVVTDIFLSTAPNGQSKSVSYEQVESFAPSTPLEVIWSNGTNTLMTAAQLLEWYASQPD